MLKIASAYLTMLMARPCIVAIHLLFLVTAQLSHAGACIPLVGPDEVPTIDPGVTAIHRSDLLRAFLRFERRWARADQAPERMRRFEQIFEGTARATFRNDVPEMLAVRDRAAAIVACPQSPKIDWRLAASLRISFDPPVLVLDSQRRESLTPEMTVQSLYMLRTPSFREVELTLEVVDDTGRIRDQHMLIATAGRRARGLNLTLTLDPKKFEPGRFTARLRTPHGEVVETGSWSVVERSLAARRDAMRATLDRLTGDDLRSASEIARSRTALVTDHPQTNRMIGMVSNPIELAERIEGEVASIARGVDPYFNRSGHLWRTFRHNGRAIPMRVYVPRDRGDSLPLVIALHGISADESVFLDGYGDGLLTTLADEHGFMIVSPLSYVMLTSDDALDEVIEAASDHGQIDRRRVFVLGYSMGGIEALRLARTRKDRLAGVCAITGTTRVPKDTHIAPTLIVVGEQDPLVSHAALAQRVDEAVARGVPVELMVMPDSSHILIVSAAMPRAIDWLLARPPAHKTGNDAQPVSGR